MESYEEYKAAYAVLQQLISESEDYIEKRTFAIASGGLTLSVALLPLLRTSTLSGLLYAAWVCFIGCLLVNLLSHCKTKRQANAMLKELDVRINQNQEFDPQAFNDSTKTKNKRIAILNWIAIGSLMIGVGCFLVFVCFNI